MTIKFSNKQIVCFNMKELNMTDLGLDKYQLLAVTVQKAEKAWKTEMMSIQKEREKEREKKRDR